MLYGIQREEDGGAHPESVDEAVQVTEVSGMAAWMADESPKKREIGERVHACNLRPTPRGVNRGRLYSGSGALTGSRSRS